MASLYAHENFPLPVVDKLRAWGHDVVTVQERGRGGEAPSDEEVLRLATAEGRAVLTLNRRDFIRLHTQHPRHAGIIVCTIDPDFSRQAERIHAAIQAVQATKSLQGELIRINRP